MSHRFSTACVVWFLFFAQTIMCVCVYFPNKSIKQAHPLSRRYLFPNKQSYKHHVIYLFCQKTNENERMASAAGTASKRKCEIAYMWDFYKHPKKCELLRGGGTSELFLQVCFIAERRSPTQLPAQKPSGHPNTIQTSSKHHPNISNKSSKCHPIITKHHPNITHTSPKHHSNMTNTSPK